MQMQNLPNEKYNVILADPPWSFNNRNTGGSLISGSANNYPVMSLGDICSLNVPDIAADDCVLLLWWVASQPVEALAVVDAWGFKVKTMTAFNWIKTTVTGKPVFGMGFWTRAGSECCLLATKGKPKPESRSVRSVFSSVRKQHSAKPPEVRDKIVELCGDLPRIELFAREKAPGWAAWGNEVK